MKNRSRSDSGRPNKAKPYKKWTIPKRRFWWSIGRIALILAVMGFGLIVVLVISFEQQKHAEPFSQTAFTAGTTINRIDPTSGKPVVEGIASTYKGDTIGHCCAASKGGWEALSNSQKDSAIQQFLR